MSGFAHLGAYSDWVAHAPGPRARAARPPAKDVHRAVREVLAVPVDAPQGPQDLRVEHRWVADGVQGEELSWSVGFGPRTSAWLLAPQGAHEPLPGVLALHGHDGFKLYGKEKIADGPEPVLPVVAALRATYSEGRAWANDLAREGFLVLVPDVFGWGSRRFRLEDMPPLMRVLGQTTAGVAPPDEVGGSTPQDVAVYNAAAWHHEHVVEKYCRLLGTTMAAVVSREDRIALEVLRGRGAGRIGTVGLSGGGCRSALLRATSDHVTAAVVVGMMSSYDALLDHDVVNHTWMLLPGDLPGRFDWPDVVASGAPAPLLVQYARGDQILPLEGALAAHGRIGAHYAAAGDPTAYTGQFVDGPHAFDLAMQRVAFDWLAAHLR
ncbi:acetylesterase [Actinotalea sp. K2]|uniref:acetylesterase n=1 Tax=Actinotalea sp. K2 TaxID=2939438 RepID=UPI002017A1E9|nr:acetylesterase [Actinotalea sp. K2]MCL3862886.1 acetylesterase [Actinotalea sp. K2]